MPPWCTCLFCIGWLGNVQRFITRAEPIYDLLNPLFCHVFTTVVVWKSLLRWPVKSHDVDLSVLCLLLYLRLKPRSHWKIPSEQNCVACRFPHWKSLYHSPMEISGNSQRNFWSNGKRPSWAVAKFSNIFSWKFLFHLFFISEFPEFSVKWFAFRKFNNFRIFWNLSQEISVPFVPISKISEFLVEWRAPILFNTNAGNSRFAQAYPLYTHADWTV